MIQIILIAILAVFVYLRVYRNEGNSFSKKSFLELGIIMSGTLLLVSIILLPISISDYNADHKSYTDFKQTSHEIQSLDVYETSVFKINTKLSEAKSINDNILFDLYVPDDYVAEELLPYGDRIAK